MKKEVIQFNENHKWCATFGYIHRVRKGGTYLIAIPSPEKGTAFIIAEREEFDIVGTTDLILKEDDDDENDND